MKHFVVYDTETLNVLRTGTAEAGMVAEQENAINEVSVETAQRYDPDQVEIDPVTFAVRVKSPPV